MKRKVEKITVDMNAERLHEDLKAYKSQAIALGATKAAIVKVEDIPVDERIVLKCQIPRCFGYGTCVHCPPHTMKPGELRQLLEGYRWAIFFILEVPSAIIVRDKATLHERELAYQKIFHMVNEIESMAFYDGHYLAFGFAAGSCRHTFCSKQDNCPAMEGKRCRISLRSRPSMEAVGIDVYKMVAVLGWEIYPIGSSAKPEDIPKGTLAGIVIVQ